MDTVYEVVLILAVGDLDFTAIYISEEEVE